MEEEKHVSEDWVFFVSKKKKSQGTQIVVEFSSGTWISFFKITKKILVLWVFLEKYRLHLSGNFLSWMSPF